ncbi:hypothetical protein MMIN_00110 [Mycolicibacter minnesotensis]|nr:hypothetical protein MMIN_00110 [Mycolicibacter minnesotensis]
MVRCLRERVPDLYFSVSATTRAPRPGEVDGVDYRFVTPAEFDRLVAENALLEWADIHGGLQRSGTPAAPVAEATHAGRPVLIEVDLAGARAIKKALPEALLVFRPAGLGDAAGQVGRSWHRNRRGYAAPTGHRTYRVGGAGRLRHRRGEHSIGNRLLRIGILAGGYRTGRGLIYPDEKPAGATRPSQMSF